MQKNINFWLLDKFKRIYREILSIIRFVVLYYPNSYYGNKLRVFYWEKSFKLKLLEYVGRGAELNFTKSTNYCIGKNLVIGKNCILDVSDGYGIYLGDYVSIALGSYIRTANHRIDDLTKPISKQGHIAKFIEYSGSSYSVIIEDDVWVGAHSIILSGAHIGKGSVISAGSVVSSVIPEYSIVAGNPARVIANRLKLAVHKAEIQKEI